MQSNRFQQAPFPIRALSCGEGGGGAAALGPAGASDRAGRVTELSAGALQAPWLLSLLGRSLWNEADGQGRHHAVNMHHISQSKPVKRVKYQQN